MIHNTFAVAQDGMEEALELAQVARHIQEVVPCTALW